MGDPGTPPVGVGVRARAGAGATPAALPATTTPCTRGGVGVRERRAEARGGGVPPRGGVGLREGGWERLAVEAVAEAEAEDAALARLRGWGWGWGLVCCRTSTHDCRKGVQVQRSTKKTAALRST